MRNARVLVVGGAGYIGGVCTAELARAGCQVVTYDDLSTGHALAVSGTLIQGDVRDRAAITAVLRDGHFDAVLHFAARIAVGESVAQPRAYYDVNVGGTITLLAAMAETGVSAFVFSSSAAVYGAPRVLPIPEDHPFAPVSPYGRTKAMIEEVVADCRATEGLRATTLRYFNAAGGTRDGRLGEAHHPETHLIPLALQAALGQRPPLDVYGDDYETRDGTCVRDYVHVLDLARAHLAALEALLDGAAGSAYNVGTGSGHTVREVLDMVGRVTGHPVPHHMAPRRAGDPPALVASAERIRKELGWEPQRSDLHTIVESAASWASAPRFGA